jgi:hypothetical protein
VARADELAVGDHLHQAVAVQVACERAKFVTGFSRWVKGQAQGWNRAVSSYGSN